jgi:hypothetical protein
VSRNTAQPRYNYLRFTKICDEVGRADARDHLQNLGVDGRIILKRILKAWDGEARILLRFRIGTGAGRAPVNADQ